MRAYVTLICHRVRLFVSLNFTASYSRVTAHKCKALSIARLNTDND